MSDNPFAAITEPSQTADPFASIAEKPDTTTSPFPAGDWRDPLTRIEPHKMPHTAKEVGQEVVKGIGNVGAGGLGVILRPVDTATNIGKFLWQATDPEEINKGIHGQPNFWSEQAKQIASQPLETAEQMVGQSAVLGASGKVAIPGARAFTERAGKVGASVKEALTGTGPRVTGELVKKTAEENAKITTGNKAAEIKHFTEAQDAAHETRGREIEHRHANADAWRDAQEATRKLEAEHAESVQNALHENEGRELAYKAELDKAKLESEDAYQKKLKEVNEQRAKTETAHREKVSEYLKKKAKIQSDLDAARQKLKTESAKQAKIAPTQTKLQQAWSNLRAGIETAREKALGIGNEKYSAVNAKLNAIEARPEFYGEVYGEAGNTLSGSSPEPTFLQNIEKRMKAKEPIRYEDLQSDYSRLGRELSKGTLHDQTYHAYDLAHEAIGKEMQRIADANGMGPQLTEARNYWRRMKQAFGKPLNPTDAATGALRSSAKDIASTADQANRIRLLGSFDERLPGQFTHIEHLQTGADALPKPVPTRELQKPVVEAMKPYPPAPVKSSPVPEPESVIPKQVKQPDRVEIPDRPAPVEPKWPKPLDRVEPSDRPIETPTKKLGTEDIRRAKVESLAKRADAFRNKGSGWANTFVILDGIRNAIHGNIGGIGEDIAVRTAFGVGKSALANILEKPEVVKFLTEPTANDIAQIPPEMRGDLQQVVQQAQAKGIKVNPQLLQAIGVAGASSKKRVGDFLK